MSEEIKAGDQFRMVGCTEVQTIKERKPHQDGWAFTDGYWDTTKMLLNPDVYERLPRPPAVKDGPRVPVVGERWPRVIGNSHALIGISDEGGYVSYQQMSVAGNVIGAPRRLKLAEFHEYYSPPPGAPSPQPREAGSIHHFRSGVRHEGSGADCVECQRDRERLYGAPREAKAAEAQRYVPGGDQKCGHKFSNGKHCSRPRGEVHIHIETEAFDSALRVVCKVCHEPPEVCSGHVEIRAVISRELPVIRPTNLMFGQHPWQVRR